MKADATANSSATATFKASTNQVRFWKTVGDAEMSLDTGTPLNDALKVSLKLDAAKATKNSPAGIANGGYWGIAVKPRTTYQGSFYAKAANGFNGSLTVAIVSADGKNQFCQRESFRPDRRLEKI